MIGISLRRRTPEVIPQQVLASPHISLAEGDTSAMFHVERQKPLDLYIKKSAGGTKVTGISACASLGLIPSDLAAVL